MNLSVLLLATGLMLERWLFEFAQIFQWPVVVLVLLLFAYSLFKLGAFVVELWQRWRDNANVMLLPAGGRSVESLELFITTELEGLRLCSPVAPMLDCR